MQEELWEVGTYLNPGNSGFAEMLKSDYVDKTGLIRLMNSRLGTKQKYLCVSRPRRFGSPMPLRCYVRIERSFPEVSQKKRSCDCDQ